MTDPVLTFLNALSLILVRLPYPFIQLLGTIIDTARQEGRQFIFITPHNLETVVKEMNKDKEHSSIGIYALSDHQQGRAH